MGTRTAARRRERQMVLVAKCIGLATIIVLGLVAATAIEVHQLNRDCSEWGWTYCERKVESTGGETVIHKNSPIGYEKGWWV